MDKLAAFPPIAALHKKNPKRDSLLDAKADRLEALIGAMYLDGENIEKIFSFIERYWFSDAAPQNFTSLFNSSQEQATKEQEDLGYQFKDSCLLQCTLGGKVPLNFLGRGLLKFIIAKFLYNRFPDFPEGELSKRAAVLLAKKAVPDFVAFKRMAGPPLDASAIVGGIYLDSDLETTTDFVLWHWTNPNSSMEVKVTLQKESYFSTSKTAIIYPPSIRTDTPSKSLRLALLSSIDQVPVFTTEGRGDSISTGFRSSVSFCSTINTEIVTSSQKKDAEKLAADKGLDELAFVSLLEFDTEASPAYPVEFLTKTLEIYTRKYFSTDFNYHVIARHPLERKHRLEVQGNGLVSIAVEAENLEEAKYKSLAAALKTTFREEWQKIKTAATPILVLSERLKLYGKLCANQLSRKGNTFEIKPVSKGKEKVSPLLIYEIAFPSLGIILNGQGYSKELAELDCLLVALQAIGDNDVLSNVSTSLDDLTTASVLDAKEDI